MKKILLNPRFHLVLLAVSLLITTAILGLSAYLFDQDEFSTTFTVVSKDDFQVAVTGQMHNDEVVFAGSQLDVNPTVTHIGDAYPAYVFAQIDLDEDTFAYDGDGINSEWCLLDGTDNVYFYGTDEDGLTPFTSTDSSTLFHSVIVHDDADSDDAASIAVTVYAIQTVGYDATDPQSVWSDAYAG